MLIFLIVSITLLVLGCVGYVLMVQADPSWAVNDRRTTTRAVEAWHALKPNTHQSTTYLPGVAALLPRSSARLISVVLRPQTRIAVTAHPISQRNPS